MECDIVSQNSSNFYEFSTETFIGNMMLKPENDTFIWRAWNGWVILHINETFNFRGYIVYAIVNIWE